MADFSGNISRLLFAIVFIITTIMASNTVYPGDRILTKTIEVIGTAPIHGDDVATARDRAISAGLVSAMELVIADFLPIESLVQNFPILNETLYAHTGKFIRDYKVLTEIRSGNIYRMMVQATLNIDGIQEQLTIAGIMLGKMAMPRVLFFITEQNIGGTSPEYWWGEDVLEAKTAAEVAMAETMQKKGFLLVDSKDKIQNIRYAVLNCEPDFKNHEVIDLGARMQADVLIVGKSIAEIAPNIRGENVKSFKGTIKVRAIRTDTGAEIASTVQTNVKANADEITGSRDSLASAGVLAGEVISGQIIAVWQQDVKTPAMVEIIVGGTHNLVNFVKFRQMLSSDMPGIRGVQIREMKPDETIITVDFEGSAEELANALMLKTFDAFGINIFEVSQDRIRIELISG